MHQKKILRKIWENMTTVAATMAHSEYGEHNNQVDEHQDPIDCMICCIFIRVPGFGSFAFQKQELIQLMEMLQLTYRDCHYPLEYRYQAGHHQHQYELNKKEYSKEEEVHKMQDSPSKPIEIDAVCWCFPSQDNLEAKLMFLLERSVLTKRIFKVNSIKAQKYEKIKNVSKQSVPYFNIIDGIIVIDGKSSKNQISDNNNKRNPPHALLLNWSERLVLISDPRKFENSNSKNMPKPSGLSTIHMIEASQWLEKSSKYLDYFDELRKEKLGPATLPTMHTILALNFAKWSPSICDSMFLLDPFCGSGATLRITSVLDETQCGKLLLFGSDIQVSSSSSASIFGVDIENKQSDNKQEHRNINLPVVKRHTEKGNHYQFITMNVMDICCWRQDTDMDAIITDLPYNVRTATVFSGPNGNQEKDELLNQHLIIKHVVLLADRILKLGGRLTFWYKDLGQDLHNHILNSLSSSPSSSSNRHFCLQNMRLLVIHSDQRLPLKRCLWVFEKQSDSTLEKKLNNSTKFTENNENQRMNIPSCRFVNTFQNRTQDPSGPGSLFEAVRKGNLEKIQDNSTLARTVLDKKGKGLLMYAAGYNRHEVVSYLLDNLEMDVNQKQLCTGQSALFFAARWGHIESLRVLLDFKADLCIRDHHGNTVLSIAAGFGHTEVIRLLIEHYHQKSEFSSDVLFHGLLLSCKYNHYGTAEILWNQIKNVKESKKDSDESEYFDLIFNCVVEICRWGHVELLNLFSKSILQKALLYQQTSTTSSGNTLLHEAIYFNRQNIILYFKENFFAIYENCLNICNNQGQSPKVMNMKTLSN